MSREQNKREAFQVDQIIWQNRAEYLFGNDYHKWIFECPSCGLLQTCQNFVDLEQAPSSGLYNCIGRYLTNANQINGLMPCNYTSGGLFNFNYIHVREYLGSKLVNTARVFAFPMVFECPAKEGFAFNTEEYLSSTIDALGFFKISSDPELQYKLDDGDKQYMAIIRKDRLFVSVYGKLETRLENLGLIKL